MLASGDIPFECLDNACSSVKLRNILLIYDGIINVEVYLETFCPAAADILDVCGQGDFIAHCGFGRVPCHPFNGKVGHGVANLCLIVGLVALDDQVRIIDNGPYGVWPRFHCPVKGLGCFFARVHWRSMLIASKAVIDVEMYQ